MATVKTLRIKKAPQTPALTLHDSVKEALPTIARIWKAAGATTLVITGADTDGAGVRLRKSNLRQPWVTVKALQAHLGPGYAVQIDGGNIHVRKKAGSAPAVSINHDRPPRNDDAVTTSPTMRYYAASMRPRRPAS